jgi:AcrR family transcriptional regulator
MDKPLKPTSTQPGRTPKDGAAPAAPTGKSGPAGTRTARHRTTVVRKAMLDTAAALFAERGFGGTNLRDVAEALGMSRPSLYYHFPSKEKLLEAIVEEVTLSAERQLTDIARERNLDPEEALRIVMVKSTEWLFEHHVLFRVLDRSDVELPEELRKSNDVSKRAILELFTSIIKRGITSGKFRPIDPHIAALTIMGMRNWAAWWYKPSGRLSQKEITETISEMAVKSLLRSDAHRSRGDRITDVLRILQEDVAHLTYLVNE